MGVSLGRAARVGHFPRLPDVPGPSISPEQRIRVTRYILCCREAVGYDSNSRNLEVFWKPVFRYFLDDAIHGMESCDVREELPIWLFYDARDQLPLNATVTMPRGGGKTVYPDLSVIMRLGAGLDDLGLPAKRFLPIVVELKRAISRSLTVQGWPDPARPEARRQICSSFGVAQTQIELAACLQMQRVDQPHIILIAGVGPWFRVCCASRKDLLRLLNNTNELEVAQRIEAMEGEDEVVRTVDDAVRGADVWTGAAPSVDYMDDGDDLDGISALSSWSPPAMMGTARADQYLIQIRNYLRLMLTTGRME